MIEIHLFGRTCISGGGTRLVARDLGGSKPRQVLEILALELGRPVTKDALAERLWEDSPPRSYIATLESYVCGLRRKLTELSGRNDVLVTTSGGYLLDAGQVRVDFVELRELLESEDLARALRALPMTVDLLLADDPYAAWANQVREDLGDRRADAFVRAARVANSRGDNELAATFARAVVHERPWSEAGFQELMSALADSGNHAQALIEYQTLRATMQDELGVEPSPTTQSLYMSILCAEEPQASYDVGILLSLLKGALEAATGRSVAGSREMAEVGRMLLARA
jgi:SARP family transcriptional regulator, regulator of embCAB operon